MRIVGITIGISAKERDLFIRQRAFLSDDGGLVGVLFFEEGCFPVFAMRRGTNIRVGR